MPIAYVYDEATGVVMTTASGVLTVEDFLEELKCQRLDDDIPKNTPGLVDLLEVERVDVGQGLSALIQIVDETVDARGYANVALLVRDPALRQLAELISSGSKSAESAIIYEVFKEREDALAWLKSEPCHPALTQSSGK